MAGNEGALKVAFEDNCVVVNDTDEYYFDSPQSIATVAQLCSFLQCQDGFPEGMQIVPFAATGRKITTRDVASSTVAFVKIEPAGTPVFEATVAVPASNLPPPPVVAGGKGAGLPPAAVPSSGGKQLAQMSDAERRQRLEEARARIDAMKARAVARGPGAALPPPPAVTGTGAVLPPPPAVVSSPTTLPLPVAVAATPPPPAVTSPSSGRPLPVPGSAPKGARPLPTPKLPAPPTLPDPPAAVPPPPTAPVEVVDDDLADLLQDAQRANTLRSNRVAPVATPDAAQKAFEARKKAEEERRKKLEEDRRRQEEERKRLEEERRQQAALEEEQRRRAEEEKRKQDELAQKAAEKKRLEEERLRAVEAERRRKLEEEQRRIQEEQKRLLEEQQRLQEEELRRQAEERQARIREERERRQAEELRRQQEEEARKAEEKRRREEEAARKKAKIEEERKKREAEEAARRAEEERVQKRLEEQRRRMQEKEQQSAEEERRKKEEEEARRKAHMEAEQRRREEEAAAARKKREQEENLRKQLDHTAQKRLDEERRKREEEEEALRRIAEEEAEEARLKKEREAEERRQRKAEKNALRFSVFMKQLKGEEVPLDDGPDEEDASVPESAMAAVGDSSLTPDEDELNQRFEGSDAPASATGPDGKPKKLKYFAKFDKALGPPNRKARKTNMRKHLQTIDYRLQRTKLHVKLQEERDAKAKEAEAQKKKEAEVLARLQRQKERAENLNTNSSKRISIMIKEKATTISRSSRANDVLSELDDMIAEEEKSSEFVKLKKRMDYQRSVGSQGRDSAAGSPAVASEPVDPELRRKLMMRAKKDTAPPSMTPPAPPADAISSSATSPQRPGRGPLAAQADRTEKGPLRSERFSVLLARLSTDTGGVELTPEAKRASSSGGSSLSPGSSISGVPEEPPPLPPPEAPPTDGGSSALDELDSLLAGAPVTSPRSQHAKAAADIRSSMAADTAEKSSDRVERFSMLLKRLAAENEASGDIGQQIGSVTRASAAPAPSAEDALDDLDSLMEETTKEKKPSASPRPHDSASLDQLDTLMSRTTTSASTSLSSAVIQDARDDHLLPRTSQLGPPPSVPPSEFAPPDASPPVPPFEGMGTLPRTKAPPAANSKAEELARMREEQRKALEEEMRILKEDEERMRQLNAKIAEARSRKSDDWLAAGKLADDDEFERLMREKGIGNDRKSALLRDEGSSAGDDPLSQELRELQRAQEQQLAELRKLEEEERAMRELETQRLSDGLAPGEVRAPGIGDALLDDPANDDPTICFTCGNKVEDTDPDPLKALNRLWHKDCWVCHECKKPLVGCRFGADGPYIYCEADYQRKFFCALCGKAIIDKIVQTDDGRLYHNKCYEKRDDQEDADFKKWMEEFVKVKDKKDEPTPAPANPGGPPTGTTASSSSSSRDDKQSVMLNKPLPTPPPGKAPSSPAGSFVGGKSTGSPTISSAAELAKLLPTTSARDFGVPRVISSPKDIAALDVPESYIFKITLPPTETKADPEKPALSVKIFDARGNTHTVNRRYKDFEELYAGLAKTYPKNKVPKVKKLKKSDIITAQHAADLESFMNTIAQLHGIWSTLCTRTFMEGDAARKPSSKKGKGKDEEISIGRPVDFKHVAHMGSDLKQ